MYEELCGEREIRLMVLDPSEASDPLVCHLRREQLSTSLHFDALSYEWKEHQGFTDITCDSTRLKVTLNLATALQALRLRKSPRVLWVDAVCINQADKEEKSKQIPLMREIYASARSVLTWLGPSFPGVEEAFKIFRSLALVGIERHPTGRPDTEKIEDILAGNMRERPKHGSIIQARGDIMHCSHDRDSLIFDTLKRYPKLDDDTIFEFDNDEVWKAIDGLFGDSYFQRSWIIQEVAVAEAVYVVCGRHKIHWDIFRLAYEGRSKLLFQVSRISSGNGIQSYILNVRDARIRYRNNQNRKCLDLGIALTSFCYSKEKDPRDRIYAALGIVKPQSLCRDIVPDYEKPVEDVFYEASCHIIRLRKDLYLWSSKTLLSRRKMRGLPSWVPEWTMETCEEAIQFASHEFSRCLQGNPEVQGHSLYLNGHILDEVDTIFPINGDRAVFELVARLNSWLKQRDQNIFSAYASIIPGVIDDAITTTPAQESSDGATQLLLEYDDIPPLVEEAIRSAREANTHPLNNKLLNIEAVCSTLSAVFYRRRGETRPPGHHLFLAMLYILPQLERGQGEFYSRLPKGFNSWIIAAVVLSYTGHSTKIFSETYMKHFDRFDTYDRMEDCFFVTRKGLFGRAPAETLKPAQVVAVLGGAYVPYLLERQDHHYQLVSHAYVEGIMSMKSLPSNWDGKAQRIEIR
ncbi:hypothetical protein S40288_08080 [Stachybotrys chartarum IBT 40288]|nr:hypothetical protein S40288_08080 [Stachybotrys chartarum IBT 40288]